MGDGEKEAAATAVVERVRVAVLVIAEPHNRETEAAILNRENP